MLNIVSSGNIWEKKYAFCKIYTRPRLWTMIYNFSYFNTSLLPCFSSHCLFQAFSWLQIIKSLKLMKFLLIYWDKKKKKKNPWMLFNNYCYDLVTEILRSVPVQVKWPIFSCQSSSSFSTPCPFLSCMGAAPHQCNDSFRIP